MLKKILLILALVAGSANAQQISAIVPNSAPQGTTGQTVTFTLAGMVPPIQVLPVSVSLGTLAGTSVSRPTQNTLTAVFDIPFAEVTGTKDAAIVFPAPTGTVTFSLPAGFSVTAGVDTPPSLTKQPQPKTVYAGLPAAFSVTASGSTPFVYQWQKDSVALLGGTNSLYSINAATLPDEGGYRCVVSNPFGSVTSAVATLSINTNELVDLDTYVVVDTAQYTCYGSSNAIAAPAPGAAFAGQDAHYAGVPPSYTLSGDGLTVYDNNTGLTWVRTADTDGDGDIDAADKLTHTEMLAYADSLSAATYGGFSDWRLPSIKELYSLMDFRGVDPSGYEGTDTSGLVPFIDTNYFEFAYGDTSTGERIIDSQYGSSNLYVSNTQSTVPTLFGVNFADGRIKGYGLSLFGSDKTFFAMYCRGNPSYGINDFADTGSGTVIDSAAGLMWQQGDSGVALTWEEALAYAEALELDGYRDWRLPNAKELQGILDYTRSPDTSASAAIDPLFSCTTITNEAGNLDYASYWTGTTHANWTVKPGNYAAYVCFGRAMGYLDGAWQDVHGAGAQRSDPKTGDPADFPTGNGPQGDAIRIFNFVRCVRGGAQAPITDTDDDGLSDWYEFNYASNATAMVATEDDDGDGASNEDEAAAGTIPTDNSSFFQIWDMSGSNTLSWTSELDRSYTIQCSTDLMTDAFSTTIESGIPATLPINSYTNLPTSGSSAHYRILAD